jgi:general secretion pathway protein D
MLKSFFALLIAVFLVVPGHADDRIKFSFSNEDVAKMIEVYSKATGQKFVLDPSVHAKASILLQEPITREEAFNQLSRALALNGFAICKQADTMVVIRSRAAQRSCTEVTTQLPVESPQRLVTYVYTLQNITADDANRQLRMLISADGEMTPNEKTNQLIFQDWSTNIQRISQILKEVDKPMDPKLAKSLASGKKPRRKKSPVEPDYKNMIENPPADTLGQGQNGAAQ